MKLFYKNGGNQSININGKVVKFVNSVATVDDEFGQEILNSGFSDFYVDGEQPAVELPKHIQMKSDFADKEEFYHNEIKRLKNINGAREEQIKKLEVEVQIWKNEYEKEHALRIKAVEGGTTEPTIPPSTDSTVEETGVDTGAETGVGAGTETDIDILKKELTEMTKKELSAFGEEMGLDMSVVANKTKDEMIEFIVNSSK